MQAQNHTPAEFIHRTDALRKQLGVSLVEVATRIGISKAMMFAYRAGRYPISDKAWRLLAEAEKRAAADGYSRPALVEESRSTYGLSKPPFAEYVSMVRALREEAERLGGGDLETTRQILDKMMDIWAATIAKRRNGNSATPFGSDAEIAARVAEIRARAEAEASQAEEESRRQRPA